MKVAEIKVSYINASQRKTIISNSLDVYQIALSHWNKDTIQLQEESKVIFLNNANIVLGIYDLSKGGGKSTIIDVKLIMSIALKCHAFGIILLHNHPSGKLKPSFADKKITQDLQLACKLLKIEFLDHLIITNNGFYSFADDGML